MVYNHLTKYLKYLGYPNFTHVNINKEDVIIDSNSKNKFKIESFLNKVEPESLINQVLLKENVSSGNLPGKTALDNLISVLGKKFPDYLLQDILRVYDKKEILLYELNMLKLEQTILNNEFHKEGLHPLTRATAPCGFTVTDKVDSEIIMKVINNLILGTSVTVETKQSLFKTLMQYPSDIDRLFAGYLQTFLSTEMELPEVLGLVRETNQTVYALIVNILKKQPVA